MVLEGLDGFVEGEDTPSDIELLWHHFFERGVSLREFEELPIPYIFSMLRAAEYRRKQREDNIDN